MTRTARTRSILILAAASFVLAIGGCGSDEDSTTEKTTGGQKTSGSELPQGSDPVNLDPADFTVRINNPYWPMAPGSKWVYSGTEGGKNERIEVTVTRETKKIGGVTARVIKDVVKTTEGDLVEVTDDWYAQDSAGNVWYLGEDTKEYENGKVSSTSGSWEAGVDGAEAGIIMPGKPQVGLSYRQEYYKGEAEDRARVLSLDATAKVPFGSFENALETEDTTPLEPDVAEHKYYARKVGPVLKTAKGGGGREELLSFTPPQ
jgi:hypothetical protein